MKRLIALLVLILVFGFHLSCGAASLTEAAVIDCLPDDPILAQIILIRKERPSEMLDKRLLFEGDIIQGPLESVSIKLQPLAKLLKESGQAIVVIEKPSILSQVAEMAQEILGFNNSLYRVKYPLSRGDNKHTIPEQYPRPGYTATLLSGEKTMFAWGRESFGNLVIINEKEKEVYRRNVVGRKNIELSVEEIGLKSGEQSRWRVDGMENQFKIRLLDEKTTQEIKAGLEKISADAMNVNDALLRKAAYLQLISDMYSERIDLYWLSYQLLLQGENWGEDQSAYQLKRRFKQHLDGQL